MAQTNHIIPATYSAGYSAIPIRVSSTTVNTSSELNYLINIVYNEVTISAAVTSAYNNFTYTKITTSEVNVFNLGDIVYFDDSVNSDVYTGYYNIVDIIDTTNFVIDLTLGAAFGGNEPSIYNVIKYKIAKDLDDEAKIDLSNTIKDFVTQNLVDDNEIFNGDNTVFNYKYIIGEEYDYEFTFEDNGTLYGGFTYGEAGKVSFYNTSIVSLTDVPFNIGDEIVVQQDLFEWTYTDNFFGPNLGFTSSNTHNFRDGQQITVTGQVTEPYYNGVTTILSQPNYPSSTSLITDKTFTTSTGPEGGVITGVPVPEYNTVCRIVDINLDGSLGVVISTDVDYQQATQPIGGIIKYVNILTQDTNESVSDNNYAYNARQKTLDYTVDGFDPYVVQGRTASLNNISTILNQDNNYRIDQSTKSWFLAHTDATAIWEPRFSFYDSSDSLISQIKVALEFTYGAQVDINTYADNGGNLRLNLNSAHGLVVGDDLEIFAAPAAYLGATTVLSVQSTTAITVDVTYTGSAVLGAEYIKQITAGLYDDYYFPVGVDQLVANTNTSLLAGATLSTVTSDVDYYTVELETDDYANTNAITLFIDTDCSKFELYHIMWKDERGSWLSFPFRYISTDKTEVERKNYYKTEEKWDTTNNTFGYDTFDRGEQTYFSRNRDKVKLNSGWIKEYENIIIKDMLVSASTYVQYPDGTLVGAQIENKDLTFGQDLKDQIWNYTIDVRLSRNEIRL